MGGLRLGAGGASSASVCQATGALFTSLQRSECLYLSSGISLHPPQLIQWSRFYILLYMGFLCSWLFAASLAVPYNNLSMQLRWLFPVSVSFAFSLLSTFFLWDISWYFPSESSWCVPGLVWRHHVVETLSFGDIITRATRFSPRTTNWEKHRRSHAVD